MGVGVFISLSIQINSKGSKDFVVIELHCSQEQYEFLFRLCAHFSASNGTKVWATYWHFLSVSLYTLNTPVLESTRHSLFLLAGWFLHFHSRRSFISFKIRGLVHTWPLYSVYLPANLSEELFGNLTATQHGPGCICLLYSYTSAW